MGAPGLDFETWDLAVLMLERATETPMPIAVASADSAKIRSNSSNRYKVAAAA